MRFPWQSPKYKFKHQTLTVAQFKGELERVAPGFDQSFEPRDVKAIRDFLKEPGDFALVQNTPELREALSDRLHMMIKRMLEIKQQNDGTKPYLATLNDTQALLDELNGIKQAMPVEQLIPLVPAEPESFAPRLFVPNPLGIDPPVPARGEFTARLARLQDENKPDDPDKKPVRDVG